MKHRRGIIITAIIVASIAIIIGFIPWALSPIAKNYIVSNAETLIGRKVEMSSMRINLLNGSLSLSDFKMYEKDGHTMFISERDPRIIYDRIISFYIQKGYPVPMDSQDFQKELKARYIELDGMIFTATQALEYEEKKKNAPEFVSLGIIVSDE